MDVSTPFNFVMVASIPTIAYAASVKFAGPLAYVGWGQEGFFVLNVS